MQIVSKNLKTAFTVDASLCGIVAPVSTSLVAAPTAPTEQRQSAVAEKSAERNEIEADLFGGIAESCARDFYSERGMNPAEYGQTRDCQKRMAQSRRIGRTGRP